MNGKNDTKSRIWTQRRDDLYAELQYLDKRREAVAELLTLVRMQESRPDKTGDKKQD